VQGGKNRGKLKEEQELVTFTKKSSSTPIEDREPEDVKRKESIEAMCDDDDCREALQCVLSPYDPSNCCDDLTPHHVVPKSQFKEKGKKGEPFFDDYKPDKAPCVCVEGKNQADRVHGDMHRVTSEKTRDALGVDDGDPLPERGEKKKWTCGKAEEIGAEAVEEVTKENGTKCDAACTKAQLRRGHKDMGVNADDQLRPTTPGPEVDPDGENFDD
jgi:hypothetical protein